MVEIVCKTMQRLIGYFKEMIDDEMRCMDRFYGQFN